MSAVTNALLRVDLAMKTSFRVRCLSTSAIVIFSALLTFSIVAKAAFKDVDAGLEALKRADYEEAVRLFTLAVETPGLSIDARTSAYVYRGNAYTLKGMYDRAIVDYSSAIRLKPDNADAYRDRGMAYGLSGQYDRAIADYSTAIRLTPGDPEVYYGRGTGYYNKGQYDRAIADFDRAISLRPDYAEAFHNRGSAY